MKKISLFIFTIVISVFTFTHVQAANASISVSSNKSRVIVGETVTVTVKISSGSALGAWKFDVVPSNNLTLIESSFGGLYIAEAVQSANQKSKTYTFKFKAKSSGTGSVSIRNSDVRSWDELSMTTTNGSTSFKMMTQAELEASYSKNNSLSSITIDGYELTPEFDKNTLEYSLELENGIESIDIKATKEDNTASVEGVGTIPLSEGVNAIKLIVTAQNGSTKTYTINVTVKELSPIEVTIGGKKYSVIQKQEFMPAASIYYEETKVTIGEKEVPGYYNIHTHFTLVGLKDESGNIGLFLYQNDTYKPYQELNFNQIAIYSLDTDEIPKGYIKEVIKIGNQNITAYTKEGAYPLVYGINLETGVTRLYQYDREENTVQRYMSTSTSEREELYFYGIVGSLGLLALTYLLILITIIRNNKKRKLKLEKTMKLQALNHQVDKKQEEDILNQTMVNIGGLQRELSKKELKEQKKQAELEEKRKAKELKKQKEEQAKLLGKTMLDITGIPVVEKEEVLSKKELKKLAKEQKKLDKKNKKKDSDDFLS